MRFAVLSVLAFLLIGCTAGGGGAGWPAVQVQPQFASSVEGRPIEVVRVGDGAEVVLVVAGIHGNEAAGIPLVRQLVTEAEGGPEWLEGRTLVVVPEMNPDGVAADTRTNSRGVDLNRNWPAANRAERPKSGAAPLSEPESAAMARLIDEVRPARILTIHQPLACVDWNGPAADLAAAMAAACDLPAKALGGRPGSMGSHLGDERGLPIITLELPRAADDQPIDERWARYGPALKLFVTGGA